MHVSFLGDSISTYEGFNPPDYAVYYDEAMQKKNDLNSVFDTWWRQVLGTFHMTLCVNDSFSGSKVSGNAFPAASSEQRLTNLKIGSLVPEVILIYIGLNDYAFGVPARSSQQDLNDFTVFENAYNHMLRKLKEYYPQAKIICGTFMRSRQLFLDNWRFPEVYKGNSFSEYNEIIRNAAKNNNCYLVDLEATKECYETWDGTHPTIIGHLELARQWIMGISELNIF